MAVISKGIKLSYKTSGETYAELTNLQEIPELGGDAEAIEITYTTADMQTFTCDKTFTEIREKLVVGKGIASIKIAVANAGILAAASSWSFLDRTNFGGTAKFVATYDDENNFIRVIHANDETITVTGLA